MVSETQARQKWRKNPGYPSEVAKNQDQVFLELPDRRRPRHFLEIPMPEWLVDTILCEHQLAQDDATAWALVKRGLEEVGKSMFPMHGAPTLRQWYDEVDAALKAREANANPQPAA